MKQHRLRARKFCAGVTLIELAIVFGVAGVILGGVWLVIVSTRDSVKLQQTGEQLLVINKNIRTYYQERPCIAATGDLTATLTAINPPLIPREMLQANNISSPWGTAVTVTRGTVAGTGAAGCDAPEAFQYTVDYLNLPPAACAALVLKATAPGEISRGLAAASINDAPITALPPNPTAIIGTAAGQCSENATAKVRFGYRLRAD
ncbi:MAG: type 4 pilus major pilin [Alphaproteobacteria bacterium]